MARTAIQCAAVAGKPIRPSTARTASANGPPPAPTRGRRARAAAAIAVTTASRTSTFASSAPPTFTTMPTRASGEDTPQLYVAAVRAAAYTARTHADRRTSMTLVTRSRFLITLLCLSALMVRLEPDTTVALLHAQPAGQNTPAASCLTGVVQGAQR